MARRILGLDLGSHAIKAVELRQSLRELEIVQMRALPRVAGEADEPAELADFLRMHDLPPDGAVVALGGDRVSTRRLHFPFRERRRISPAVPFEVEAQVPFDLDDFFVDWEAVGSSDGGTDVVATLAPRAEVATLLERLAVTRIDPRIVEAEGLLLSNLAVFFDLPGTRLLIDLGHRKTNVALLLDGQAVAARTIPLGGEAITVALADDLGVSLVEAERRKHEEGVLGTEGGAPRPAEQVVERLVRELARTLGSLETLLGSSGAATEVTLCGGTAHLHRLDEVLAERLGLPVRRLAAPPGAAGTAVLATGDPLLFAPALALAVRGSMRTRTRMNFRQGELAHRIDYGRVGREFRGTAVLAATALLLGLVAVATGIVLESRRGEALERQAQALYLEAFPNRPPPPNVVAAMQQAVSEAQDKADTLGVYRGNLSALDILTEISAHIPGDVDVVFEELSIDGQVIQIKGHTPAFEAVDRLRAELARYAPFSAITVGEISRDPRRGGQTFSMRISMAEDGSET
jgi:Tfp pilus assembly PilM family ATPase/Tfp pilus assembly protein PilN